MMVCGLNPFPTVILLLSKEVLQPIKPSLAHVVNKALTCLVAFDNRFLLAGGLWNFLKRDVIFPSRHRQSFLDVP